MTNSERPPRTSGVATPLALALALVTAVGGGWLGWSWQEKRGAERLAAAQEVAAAERAELERQAQQWATAVAERAGRATFRAFLAGVHPALVAERHESFETSAAALLRLGGVVAIHVMRPDGTVVYSSDAKYPPGSQAGDRAGWALGATEPAERPGELPGTLELAAPVGLGGEPVSRLWFIYRPGDLRDAGRPAALAGAAPPDGA